MSNMIQFYHILSIVGFLIAGVFFAVAVFLFFFLNISEVIGYLTGKNAQRAIEEIRKQNEQRADVDKQNVAGVRRKVQTDKFNTAKLRQQAQSSMQRADDTVPLQQTETAPLFDGDGETTLLNEVGATTVLNDFGETSLLNETGGANSLNETGETTVLGQTEKLSSEQNVVQNLQSESAGFAVIEDITFIHTSERIE